MANRARAVVEHVHLGRRKRRTRQHVIADLSINYIELHVLKCGFTAQRITNDYGLDLLVSVYNEHGEIQNSLFHIQAKATDRLKLAKSNTHISFRVSARDLEFWQNEVYPVILILYDAQTERAYWLYVQAY